MEFDDTYYCKIDTTSKQNRRKSESAVLILRHRECAIVEYTANKILKF